MPNIYKNGELCSPVDLANHANAVHHALGAKGNPYTPEMFTPNDKDYRLSGVHCDCGCDEKAVGKPTFGEFELFAPDSEDVQSGGKAYMICRKCGCYSHL